MACNRTVRRHAAPLEFDQCEIRLRSVVAARKVFKPMNRRCQSLIFFAHLELWRCFRLQVQPRLRRLFLCHCAQASTGCDASLA